MYNRFSMDRLAEFEQYRPLLFSIAYRMLGSVMDAEDRVQEAFLRWLRAPENEVQSSKAYLSAIVTRLCAERQFCRRASRIVEEAIGHMLIKSAYWKWLMLSALALLLASCVGSPPVTVVPAETSMPAWSPDGSQVAFVCTYGGSPMTIPGDFVEYRAESDDICIMDLKQRHKIIVTQNNTRDVHPTWSPNSQQLAYIGENGLYVVNSSGTGQKRLVNRPGIQRVSWSPDGDKLAFSECRPDQAAQIFVVGVDGTHLLQLTDEALSSSENPVWSPDGSRLVYQVVEGACGGTEWLKDSSKLRIWDSAASKMLDLDNQYYPYVHDLSWVDSDSIVFSHQVRIPNSDAKAFQLYSLNSKTRQSANILPRVFGMVFARSSDGALIAYSDFHLANQLYVTSPSGIPKRVWTAPDQIHAIAWSPDTKALLVTSSDPFRDRYIDTVWLVRLDGSAERLLERATQ